MGVCIFATNSKYEFNMGYGNFFILRKNIASALDGEFGKLYAQIIDCRTKSQREDNDRAIELIINRKNLDEKYKDILDFLYMSDCDGKISHKTCKQIYEIIKDIDFENQIFQYSSIAKNDYEEFKKFLLECYSKRRLMQWC